MDATATVAARDSSVRPYNLEVDVDMTSCRDVLVRLMMHDAPPAPAAAAAAAAAAAQQSSLLHAA